MTLLPLELLAETVSITLAANAHPYSKHVLHVSDSPLGLRAVIESFLPGQPLPSRVEFGPLRKLASNLRTRYSVGRDSLVSEVAKQKPGSMQTLTPPTPKTPPKTPPRRCPVS